MSEDAPKADPAAKLVLIVDDDNELCTLISIALQIEGFQTATALNGAEAIKAVRKRMPDLIITDLMMPQEGGYEFLRNLTVEGGGRVPVFVMTGFDRQDSTIELIRREANVVEFIKKPFNPRMLALSVHQTLGTDWKKRPSDPWSTPGSGAKPGES